MGHYILRALVRPRFALPLAAGVLVLLAWWGVEAYTLARQIDSRIPTQMKFVDAVKGSRSDQFLYARFSDARIDCARGIRGDFGQAYALRRADGRIAAMMRRDDCNENQHTFEGVFRHPPYGLYGAAIEYWGSDEVTKGHLSFFEREIDSRPDWREVAFAVAVALATVIWCLMTLVKRRTRALGVALIAMSLWLIEVAKEHVVFEVIPVPSFALLPIAIGLGLALFPSKAFSRKIAERLLGDLVDT